MDETQVYIKNIDECRNIWLLHKSFCGQLSTFQNMKKIYFIFLNPDLQSYVLQADYLHFSKVDFLIINSKPYHLLYTYSYIRFLDYILLWHNLFMETVKLSLIP